eukprot:CAMPEP_0204008586 /NCGR_PEP_ID=MMETSP0360-20130528/21260_1 /ASSEMBLY_ACC=CAM_ASM_000342 /TAXON_ID=268821 /ORGANISM="Scrippsiella Hangoei, Strain SHTV-5" /LENGTH=61 /DNA_ID=CAMNT_0050950897 /DNA_START=189 /DNA_END=370 /DNA_ORIENTATION=-
MEIRGWKKHHRPNHWIDIQELACGTVIEDTQASTSVRAGRHICIVDTGDHGHELARSTWLG